MSAANILKEHLDDDECVFKSERYTIVLTYCHNCGEEILEAQAKDDPKPKRVECYLCLHRWWMNRRLWRR
jgi:hypothetical protein